ncbi:GGDEF domain-containing protein [Paraburkholderia azotifigens]|uniref:diguanylate cyclase n=1 Tax=Paraburkholderia azotifigens TaxID=2057004 RepID=A0A5C6VJ66_9BURK|nr:sensor domain-containing diguanylate cyclase [Paraburkholderia azotifigens]TXC85533.1 GGDEF domain-containing protein [Paraburkholderia azotifigens]
MEGFLVQHATRKQTVFAGTTALLIVLTLAIAAPRASLALPAVGPFMPMCALTVFTTAGIATFLLGAQFTVTRQPVLGALGGAYAFTALTVALQLLTFPGVFTPTGLLGAGPYSAAWMWVFWHGGFPFFVILAALTRDRFARRPISTTHVGLWAGALIGGPVMIGAVLGGFAIYAQLPPALNPASDAGTFLNGTTAPVIWSLNVMAMVVVLWTGRLRAMLDLWLSIAVLACFTDTSLNLLSAGRFTVGWYLARLFSMFAPGILVCVLVWNVTVLYRRLFEAHASLLQMSVRDALTGIYNRSYFNEQFHKEFDRARRHRLPLSLIMIDVDHFKQYNDAFGHLEGDACLVAVASALAGTVRRPGDFVARYGGEEFAIVLPDTGQRDAGAIAERAREAVLRLGLETQTAFGCVTVSAGCATLTEGNVNGPDELVDAADAALYRAKGAGRNRSHL